MAKEAQKAVKKKKIQKQQQTGQSEKLDEEQNRAANGKEKAKIEADSANNNGTVSSDQGANKTDSVFEQTAEANDKQEDKAGYINGQKIPEQPAGVYD